MDPNTTSTVSSGTDTDINTDTDSDNDPEHPWKPILILINPPNPTTTTTTTTTTPSESESEFVPLESIESLKIRFPQTLTLLQKKTHLLQAPTLEILTSHLTTHATEIAGFILQTTTIMHPQNRPLSKYLASLLHAPQREYTILFAFDFPTQAARDPLRFASYVDEVFFGLGWRVCGWTVGRAGMVVRRGVGRKMGKGWVYRGGGFGVAGVVVLRGVKMADKVVFLGRELLGEMGGLWMGLKGGWEGRIDESGGEEGGEQVGGEQGRGGGGGGEENEWADDELTSTDAETESQDDDDDDDDDSWDEGQNEEEEDNVYVHTLAQSARLDLRGVYPSRSAGDNETEADEDDWVPSDDEGTEEQRRAADCVVAIHEVKSWMEEDGEEVMVRGYLGFVGHVDDDPSMAELILGMCVVESHPSHPAGEEMETDSQA